jgi:hypothetical protein
MSDDEIKIITLNPNKEEVKNDNEEIDLSHSIENFTYTFRMLYMDYMCDDAEAELDAETIRFSYQFERELKYVLFDNNYNIETFVQLFMDAIFDPEKAPFNREWMDLIADDDMKLNALRVVNTVLHSVLVAGYKVIEDENEEEE